MTPVPVSGVLTLAAERTSTGEAVQFWVLGTVAVLGALGVVTATKAVYSAIFLATTMIVLAVFYVAQARCSWAWCRWWYTGAVMMLFLFVLMLIGVDSSDSLRETLRGQRTAAVLIAAGFAGLLCAGIANATVVATTGSEPGPVAAEGVGSVGRDRPTDLHRLPVGVRAHSCPADHGNPRCGGSRAPGTVRAKRTQREVSIERFRRGGNATLPNPGVRVRPAQCRRHPARLPNGSLSELSVPGHVITKQIQTDRCRSARAGAGQVRS